MPQDRKLKGGFDYIYFQKLKYGLFILFGEAYDGFCVILWFIGWCIVLFVLLGFLSWWRNRDIGLAVVSFQLHLHCDGLLILLTHTQLLLGPENKYNSPSVTGKHRDISVKGKMGLHVNT